MEVYHQKRTVKVTFDTAQPFPLSEATVVVTLDGVTLPSSVRDPVNWLIDVDFTDATDGAGALRLTFTHPSLGVYISPNGGATAVFVHSQ